MFGRMSLSLTFRLALRLFQAGRLGMGATQSIVTFLKECVLFQFSYPPLVASIVAATDANLGLIMAISPLLKATLEPLCTR